MEVDQLIARLARGGRTQELTTGERAVGSNRIFRMWTENQTRIMKVYGTAARERRERHSLTALRGIPGIPTVLDRGAEGDIHWAIFEDAGSWNLANLPENSGLTRRAGEILRQVHESETSAISNLARGIDQEWVTVDFVSTFRRVERYRGRLGLSEDLLEAARGVRPPFASEPRVAHTNPAPDNFLVDDRGNVTMINWEWATLAPVEWDLSKVLWLLSLRSGTTAAAGLAEGYGAELDPAQLDRWTVYHAGMMLVYEAENRIKGRLDDLGYLVDELQRAITGSRAPA
ncbi:MAG: aminoglycoside phosphotransferase family protein [Acidimicrobiia bacterium]|nr:aminoglycoside phosphotransferase family protein [Acidimicrobiia bacterium]MDH3470680.1 aminoglycoside phosphotransferase family protein [Acidimicrobiia bacterium]